jgi:dTDP-4-dehydrorhamnose reductase
MMETNAVGVENLVNSASTIESLKCFCHVSSAGVTGKTSDLVVTEETPCNPGNLYEESKWIGEKHILDSNLACPIRILRPINVIDKENKGILDFIFNKNFKSYLKLLLLGRENAHVVPASMIAKAALHLSLTPGINEKVFFVSLDEDPKNKFFDLWKLISKSNFILSLPLFMTNLIRTKLLGGNASQTKYSSQLLKNTGFKSFPTIEEVIQEVSQ